MLIILQELTCIIIHQIFFPHLQFQTISLLQANLTIITMEWQAIQNYILK